MRIQEQVFHQGVPEPHHRCAFVLHLHVLRVDRFAHVAGGDQLVQQDLPGRLIDLDLAPDRHHLPERRGSTQGVIGTVARPRRADPDQLTAGRPKVVFQYVLVGPPLPGQADLPLGYFDVLFRDPVQLRGDCAELAQDILAGR